MADELDPKQLAQALVTDRWSALTRADLNIASVATWDPKLVRQPRLLVPIDVQALYVPSNHDERFVKIPLALTIPDGSPPVPPPRPFKAAVRRPRGVHLQWTVPDALMAGELLESAGGVAGLSALANRWVVLRIIAPEGAGRTHVRGWVVEADTSRVFNLEDWSEGRDGDTPSGRVLMPEELTGAAGGAVNWTTSYDATLNRFALHDPLDDIENVAGRGVFDNLATYLIAGWWSEQSLDPLDPARTAKGLEQRLNELKWSAPPDQGTETPNTARAKRLSTARTAFGLTEQTRIDLVDLDVASAATERLARIGATEIFMPDGSHFAAAEPKKTYSTLLHGQIHGVPIAGPVVADRRPDPGKAEIAVGIQMEDVVASLAASGLGIEAPDKKRQAERLLTAITNDLMPRVGDPNGAVDIEEREHAGGFLSTPGGGGADERIIDRGGPETLIAGRRVGAKASQSLRLDKASQLAASLRWTGRTRGPIGQIDAEDRLLARIWEKPKAMGAPKEKPVARIVRRPGPRYHQPEEPILAIRNAKRAIRQRCDGRASADGKLACRWPSQVQACEGSALNGVNLLGPFPTGAIPPEVLALARHAVAFDPYIGRWVADAAAKETGLDASAIQTRLNGEAALRFSTDGVYDGAVPAFRRGFATRISPIEAQIGDQLRRFSTANCVDPDPVSVSTWAQPWLPTWLEWEVDLHLSDRLDGWSLGAVDLESDAKRPGDRRRRISGRSPINVGAAKTLTNAIDTWIRLEDERDKSGEGEADAEIEERLTQIVEHLRCLDLASASLNGIIGNLLGLPVAFDGEIKPVVDDEIQKVAPVNLPLLLYSGRLVLRRARLIDTFGRVLDLDARSVRYPSREALTEADAIRLRPRFARPARWNFRFADPGDRSAWPRPATIDQAQPELMINPVSGYLLPDLIDEALEVFDATGDPVGQLMHEPIGGGVMWEIAPGRDGPGDSGPLFGLAPEHETLGRFAAAMVEEDARARGGEPIGDEDESALSAFLRAVDTTLWTVDAFAALGTPHIAGLVGRPMAVVRASLSLQIDDDLEELDLSNPDKRRARERAYENIRDRGVTVRLGELTRDDDGLYGFFVNDDFSRFRLVDKLIQKEAFISGPRRGQLGPLGASPQIPDSEPITHPYIVGEDELVLHPGEIVRLTLLMHPAGKVHLTSGILPRKSLQLVRDWTHGGLSRIAPSARIGPVLIDPDKVRLPRIASFGKEQIWTRRDTPTTWRDDPILAATQTALLPDNPARVEEGYVRIAPVAPEEEDD